MCSTKVYTGKNKTQKCSKRNLVYHTFCITCQEKETERINAEAEDVKKAQDHESLQVYRRN
jgi:hypothetical protein